MNRPPWPQLSHGFRLLNNREHAARDLAPRVAAWAKALRHAGVSAHEPVGLWAPLGPATLQALLALRHIQASVVLLHPRWTAAEAAAVRDRAGCRLVLADPALAPRLGACPLPAADGILQPPPLTGPVHAIPGQFLVPTSGTEGEPKLALLGEGALRAHAHAAAQRMGSEADDVWLASLPLAHVGGLALVLRALAQGCGLAVPPEPVVAALDGTIRRHRVTHLSLVPTQLRRWLDLRGDAPPPGSLRCVLVGGAACPPELLTRARAHGLPVRATYGLTEACSQVATADAATPLGSVGLPLAGLQIRIQEPDAGSAASGRIGRILVRGPTLFLGYLGDDAATADALRDGWLWTRDLGRLDEDGRLWVVGRLDDVIVTGGENVDPVEVEAVLEDHPDVQEAAVVAAPDAEWGQLVVACIVPRPGANPTLDGLREHCASRLAKYKCPRRLLIVEHLPRTGMGKVRRSALRAQAASPSLAP